MKNPEIYYFLISMVALVICITIHEFAHAMSAYKSGDDTPRAQGRLSLNPLDHLDPVGTLMMLISSWSGFGIGWGKPVMVNPRNFKNPRWDNLKVSLWGPLSNLLTAAVVGTVIRFWGNSIPENVAFLLVNVTIISITLAVFNLIPIGPLDGSHIVASLLPYEKAKKYEYMMARYGLLFFFALIMLSSRKFDLLGLILRPPTEFLLRLFVGK